MKVESDYFGFNNDFKRLLLYIPKFSLYRMWLQAPEKFFIKQIIQGMLYYSIPRISLYSHTLRMLRFSVQINCLLYNVMGLKDLVGITEDCSDFLQRQMPSVREEKPGTDRKYVPRNDET
jgi:hypothetical protein